METTSIFTFCSGQLRFFYLFEQNALGDAQYKRLSYSNFLSQRFVCSSTLNVHVVKKVVRLRLSSMKMLLSYNQSM